MPCPFGRYWNLLGLCAVPIRSLLENERGAFGPDEVASVVTAFEMVLRKLKLVDRQDPAVLMVARTTLEIARQGETDPERLSSKVLSRMSV
jgi:hypothetical protein